MTTKPATKTAAAKTPKKAKGLGRGLDALLGADMPAVSALGQSQNKELGGEQVLMLKIQQLQPGKYQPRTRMDEGALADLAESIRNQGVMQPILARSVAQGKFEIIAGERRFRAAQLAALAEVPVLVREVDDEHAALMALIENIQREDLNPLEEAQGVQQLIAEFGMTHEQAAKAIGRSRSATSNLLRLLNLAGPVQIMLLAGDLDMGHARALLAVDAATQIQLANEIIARRLSVREAEKLVSRALEADQILANRKSKEKSRDVLRLEEALSDRLGTQVAFKLGSKERGQLIIDFHGWEHLSSLLEKQGLGDILESN
ncbi:MAG: ParB/RepB/Spo0J family partition protein [Pigmentiphaga sp.]|nr:ParB/RepB/Spo0J family partition protein [Pigmentiphaga sp.]